MNKFFYSSHVLGLEKQGNHCSKPLQPEFRIPHNQHIFFLLFDFKTLINTTNWLTFLAPQFSLPSLRARPIRVLKIPLQGNWADHLCLVLEVFPYLLVFGLMNLILLTKTRWLL